MYPTCSPKIIKTERSPVKHPGLPRARAALAQGQASQGQCLRYYFVCRSFLRLT